MPRPTIMFRASMQITKQFYYTETCSSVLIFTSTENNRNNKTIPSTQYLTRPVQSVRIVGTRIPHPIYDHTKPIQAVRIVGTRIPHPIYDHTRPVQAVRIVGTRIPHPICDHTKPVSAVLKNSRTDENTPPTQYLTRPDL